MLAQATSYSQSCAAPVWRATIGEQASMRSARPMMAEPLVSFRKGMATFESSWRSSKFGASKTCRLWLLQTPGALGRRIPKRFWAGLIPVAQAKWPPRVWTHNQ